MDMPNVGLDVNLCFMSALIKIRSLLTFTIQPIFGTASVSHSYPVINGIGFAI